MYKVTATGILIIRKSCLTGKAVWIYRGPSKQASWKAYWRACCREEERVRNWPQTAARRKENILRLLSDCMSGLPLTGELPPEKEAAARQLLAISKKGIPCRSEFYEHFMEERRRRAEDLEIHRQMREREKENNRGYDK